MLSQKTIIVIMCLLSTSAYSVGDPTAGKIKSQACASCHGPEGNSVGKEFPNLAGQQQSYLMKQLSDYRLGQKSGRYNPIMAGFAAKLTDTDIADIASYYASQTVILGAVKPEYLLRGQELYRAGDRDKHVAACTACHNPMGAGNAEAKFPSLSGQCLEYTLRELKAFRDGARYNDPHSIMRDIAANLSDQDMLAVASYVSGLH